MYGMYGNGFVPARDCNVIPAILGEIYKRGLEERGWTDPLKQ